jgi:hypothetical protein
MKKILLCAMILVISTSSFGQQIDTSKFNTRKYYLRKSRSQLVGGLILLGIGGTTLALVSNGKTSFDILPVLVIGGGLFVLGSIPLFIASGRNKRKAMNATTLFKMETIPTLPQTRISFHSYPAISVRFDL